MEYGKWLGNSVSETALRFEAYQARTATRVGVVGMSFTTFV